MNLESQPSSRLIVDQDCPSSSIRIKRARRTEAAAADWLRRKAINSLRTSRQVHVFHAPMSRCNLIGSLD
jgi:hypothetical protein